MNTYESLKEETLALFRGLMAGSVKYSFDNLNCAMKTDVCEVFNDVAEEFVMNVEFGQEVTKEQLQEFYEGLIAFGEDFNVSEATFLAKKVKGVIENS